MSPVMGTRVNGPQDHETTGPLVSGAGNMSEAVMINISQFLGLTEFDWV